MNVPSFEGAGKNMMQHVVRECFSIEVWCEHHEGALSEQLMGV